MFNTYLQFLFKNLVKFFAGSQPIVVYFSSLKYLRSVPSLAPIFALVLVDFSKDVLYYSTDIFSIKPLWFAQDGDDIGLCSYESSLKYLAIM